MHYLWIYHLHRVRHSPTPNSKISTLWEPSHSRKINTLCWYLFRRWRGQSMKYCIHVLANKINSTPNMNSGRSTIQWDYSIYPIVAISTRFCSVTFLWMTSKLHCLLLNLLWIWRKFWEVRARPNWKELQISMNYSKN